MSRRPQGGPYEWYTRGLAMLGRGDAAAAAQLLAHAREAEPDSRSVREALARAQFDSGRYSESAETFGGILEEDPADDYAHFGLGLALARLGEPETARGHLAMAAAMRPSVDHYNDALERLRSRPPQ